MESYIERFPEDSFMWQILARAPMAGAGEMIAVGAEVFSNA